MTVAELIEQLSKFDPDLPVYTYGGGDGEEEKATEVEHVPEYVNSFNPKLRHEEGIYIS